MCVLWELQVKSCIQRSYKYKRGGRLNINVHYTNHILYVHYTNIKTPTSPINSSLYHSRYYFTTLRPPTMYKPLGIALMSVPSKRPSIE